jgi:hypothetical protein
MKNIVGIKKTCTFAHPFEREGVLRKGAVMFLERVPV